MNVLLGMVLVVVAGLGTGSCLWPIKVIRRLKFEHYWFCGMLPLMTLPWIIVFATVPDPWAAFEQVGWRPLVAANLFGIGWGIANVLGGMCVARIGYVLTGAIFAGLGMTAGVVLPIVVKGTGVFENSPDLTSKPGLVLMVGVGVVLMGVTVSAVAGFGRERVLKEQGEAARPASGGFLGGLIMALVAGVLSCGMPLAFVYGQGPIREAVLAQSAGDLSANMAVWAAGLFGGALVNILYPACLMTIRDSWGELRRNVKEAALAMLMGTQLITSVALLGVGMVSLGALGASIGIGVQQSVQIVGSQTVGFISGEWRGVFGKPRLQVYLAIAILFLGVIVMGYAKTFTVTPVSP